MDEWETISNRQMILYCIQLIGIISIFLGINQLFDINTTTIYYSLAIPALFFFIFAPWVVHLPSGASWRPAMAFIFYSLLSFDYRLVILVAIPGALLIAWGGKDFLSRFLLTIGHLALGIYVAGIVYGLMGIKFTPSILSYTSITICLFTFFVVNRFVSAIIVAIHKQRSILKQIYLIKNDLNWGYSSAYILGILMYLVSKYYGVPGFLLVIILLITLYQAFSYFQKLKDIEGKVYLDGLTDAESRMSWEEFQKENNDLNGSGVIFMMDLDCFKMINDTFGHNFGDQILQEFVTNMKKEMKRRYRLFRYGGDEFILVVYAGESEFANVCSEISNILYYQNERWKQKGLAVSVSFGYANLTEQESIENIVRKADKSMYTNKFGRNSMRSV